MYVGAGLQALLQYASQLSATQARNTLQVGGVVGLFVIVVADVG